MKKLADNKTVFITGTDTGVGKTVVTCLLGRGLRERGLKTAVMKPVASGGSLVKRQANKMLLAKDKEIFEKGLKGFAACDIVNPVCLKEPLAPYVAAQIEKRKINFKLIYKIFARLREEYDIVVAEGIGGLMVPLAREFFVGDLVKKLKVPLVIIARPNLGTLNHTFLTINYAKSLKIPVKGIILNYAEKTKQTIADKTNPQCLTKVSGVPVLGTIPYFPLFKKGITCKGLDALFQKNKGLMDKILNKLLI